MTSTVYSKIWMIQARFMENWTRTKHPEADNYTDRHDNEETGDGLG